jgi:hypothetical protein
MAEMVLLGGAGFFNPYSQHLYNEKGKLMPNYLETHTFPTELGMQAVQKHVLSHITDKRLMTPARVDANGGIPKFVIDIYDMDGQQVVSTMDFVADFLLRMVNSNVGIEQAGAQLAYEINHLPQPA